MRKWRNLLGDVDKPYFLEVVLRGHVVDSNDREIPAINIFHFHRLDNTPTYAPGDLVGLVQAVLKDPLLSATNVRYHIEQWEERPIDDPAAASFVIPDPDAGAIGNDASAYANQSAVYMLIRTGYRGKSYKGSKHFAGIDEAHVTRDELVTTGLGLWQNVRNALRTFISAPLTDDNGNIWYPFVLSRELSSLGPTDIPAVVSGADWDSVELNLTVGTMKGRKEATKRSA